MRETFDEQVSTLRVRAARGTVTSVRHLTTGRAVTTSSGGDPAVEYRSVWTAPPPRLDEPAPACRHWLHEVGRRHPKLVVRLLSRARSIAVTHDDCGRRQDRTTHISIMIDGRLATPSPSPVRARGWLIRDLADLTVADLDHILASAAGDRPSKVDPWPWPDREKRLPVVFAPGVGGTALHEVVGHGLEADHGRPTPKPGTNLGSRAITVIDDPTRPGLWGSRRIDDQGAPAAPITLVERGTVCDALHIRESSPAASSARRMDYRSRPLARMSNTYLAPGVDDPAALLQGTAVVYCAAGGWCTPSGP